MVESCRHNQAKSNEHKAQDSLLVVFSVTQKNRYGKESNPEKEQHMSQVVPKMDDRQGGQN